MIDTPDHEPTTRDAGGEPLHEALRAWVATHTRGSLWGQERDISPRLCDTVYGDGMRLFRLTTINSRPDYYVIRGDSSWKVSPELRPGHDFGDFTDAIREDLEEQFGSGRIEDHADWDEEKNDWVDLETGNIAVKPEWPAFDDDTGIMWGDILWPDHLVRDALETSPEAREVFRAVQAGSDLRIRARERDGYCPPLLEEAGAYDLAVDGTPVSDGAMRILVDLGLLEARQRPWQRDVDMTLSDKGREIVDAVGVPGP